MWRAVQEWQKIAEEINAGKEGKDRKPLYVYAHNGSKFDAIEAMHSILANDGEVPTDQLESNGKFISFAWRDLVFRDSCLITMSSLASACTAFGLETSKGFLPYRYLQNCHDEDEILSVDGLALHPRPWATYHLVNAMHRRCRCHQIAHMRSRCARTPRAVEDSGPVAKHVTL